MEKKGMQMRLGRKSAKMIPFLMLLAIANFAAGVTLVPESTGITSCICETNLVKIVASNPGDSLESVIMGSSGDKPWAIPGPKEFNLQPRSSRDITAFVTPDCFAVPGKYSVSVKAQSAFGSAQTTIGVDVSACVQLPSGQAISLCRGETASSKMMIRNIARDEARSYIISASSKNMPEKSVGLPSSKVLVGLNSQKEFEYTIDASALNVGSYSFEIQAQALYEATDVPTTDVATSQVKVEVKDCESFDWTVLDSVQVCAGVPTLFKTKLINKGSPANIKLTSDSSYIALKPVSGILHVGEIADVEMNINAPRGEYAAKLYAKSDLKSVEKAVKIVSRECSGVEMQMQSDKVICTEDGAEFDLVLRNRDNPAEYSVSVSGIGATLSNEKISLGKGELRTLKVGIPKDSSTGTFPATITAASKEGKDSITKEISVQKCYDFRLTGPELELCPCEQSDLNYELINFGIKDDTFALQSGSDFLTLKESSASVKSKQKMALSATFNSCSLEPGKYNGIISASSGSLPGNQDSLKIDLTVKSKEQCYGIELKSNAAVIPSKCEIKSQAVSVINKGTKQTAVSLSATQGSKVTPDNLLLDAGETREVTLVIFPSPSKCGTTFNVDMKAEGKGTAAVKQFKVEMEPEEKSAPATTITPVPSAPVAGGSKELDAEINYTNDTLLIRTLPDVKVEISDEAGNVTINQTDEQGNFMQGLGTGAFLITLSRTGYKPVILAVNVTGEGADNGGVSGNLGTIPLLLVAFLIIVAALYFVLRRGGEESVEEGEEEEEEKPKRRGRRRK